MAVKNAHISKFHKGMNRDITERLQPEGTYRYALSAVMDPHKKGCITSEKGLSAAALVDANQTIIGAQQLDDHRWLIFTTRDSNNTSHLYIFDPIDGSTTKIVDTTTFNWRTSNPMLTLLKIVNGCDRVVYFTDNLNPYRAINIDDLDQYGDPFDGSRTNVSREINSTPNFESIEVRNDGGSGVLVGTYNFAVCYTDKYGNATNVVHTSQPVPIYQDPIDGQYTAVAGNQNLGGTNTPGGVPPTTKSIRITLSNLDQEFEYYKIYSIHTILGTGEITAVYEHPLVKIEDTTSIFIFTGTNDAIISTLQQIDVGNLIINKVKDHEQLDGRLYIANLTDEDLDWPTIQRAANEITATWETVGFSSTPSFTPEDCKSATGYTDYRTYMRDEVYAYGIQGRLKANGRLTPVFHIPGRSEILSGDPLIALGNTTCATAGNHSRNEVPALTDWDRQLLDVITGPGGDNSTQVLLANVKHLGFSSITDDPYGDGPGKIQRWRVYNTAITNTLDTIDSSTTGVMAYWESLIDYPSQVDCDEVRIYPEGKIRHHKFPDTNLMRHCSNSPSNDDDVLKYIIGIRFDLTDFLAALPADITDAVEGWEIVRAERTDINSSVMDKGLIYHQASNLEDEADTIANYTFYNNIVNFVSPRTMFNRDWLGNGYLKIERVMYAEDNEPSVVPAGQASVAHRDPVHYSFITDEESHRKIEAALYLSPPFPYYTTDLSSDDGYPNISDDLAGDLIDANRYSIHQFTIKLSDDISLYGNPYGTADSGVDLPNSRVTQYCSLKRVNDTMYSNFDTLKYYRISNNSTYNSGDLLFGGDSFVHRYTYREKFSFKVDDPWTTPVQGILVEHVGESIINTELRTKGGGDFMPTYICNAYIPNYLNTEDVKDPQYYTNNEDRYQDFLDYNKDYSQTNRAGLNIQIPSNFDLCSECLHSYPYRIYYSDKSFQEEISDNYRNIAPSNYRDLIGDAGEVTSLFTANDQLYAQTPKSTWFMPTRPQQLTTNENTVELGTGDFLSLPPKRLVTPSYAYGGCIHPYSVVSTEYGTIYVDTLGGSIYMLTPNNLEDLSLKGMKQWCKENVGFKLNDQFIEEYQTDYPIISTTSTIGIGYTAAYDPEVKRVIITKRDYEIIDPDLVTWTGTQWEAIAEPGDAIIFSDTNYFNDKSWTMSYSLPDQAWVSFHPYTPNLLFNDARNFYHTTTARQIWQHNYFQHLKSYTTFFAFDLDFIINPNPIITKTLSSISLLGDIEEYSEEEYSYLTVDDTMFSNISVYNSFQSTGQLRILIKEPFESILYDPLTIYTEKVDRQWKMSDFRNLIVDYTVPIWTVTPNGIARVENSDAFDLDKSLYEQERLRDTWFGVKLHWATNAPYRISLDTVTSIYSQSFR